MVHSRGGINQTSGGADCKVWQTGLVRLVLPSKIEARMMTAGASGQNLKSRVSFTTKP